MEEELQNFGLIEEQEIFSKDYRMGGISGITKKVLREDGNYTDFLPEPEYQAGVYFDTYGCVSFTADNCLETIAKIYGLLWNKSDRFTAKMSGTTKSGNYMRTVAESLRLNGVVDEENWPYPRTQRTPVFTWDDYYKEIPEDLIMEGKRFLLDWDINWEWTEHKGEGLMEALKYGPVKVSVLYRSKPDADGLFRDGGNRKRNHNVMCFNAVEGEYFEIFDSYDKVIKRFAWDYDFRWAIQYFLTSKKDNNMPLIKLPNNVHVQLIDPPGGFALHLDGKLLIDDLAKINASFGHRNNGDVKGKYVQLTKEQWDSFPKEDLKGNKL